MNVAEAQLRAELVAVGAALERQGLLRAGEGNFSCRLGEEAFLVTPRGARKGRLACSSLLLVPLAGPVPADASSEVRMHLEIYRFLRGVGAVVHAHPPAVLALTLARPAEPLPDPALLPEGKALLGTVGAVPPLPPGSPELARATAATLAAGSAAVLLGHGAVAVAESPLQALARIELLELLACLELLRRGRAVSPL